MHYDLDSLPSPCFVLEEQLLRNNLNLLSSVQERAGVQIILAFKAFAMWSAFPIVREYLSGATASSLYEARLCVEEMGAKAHTYAPAYLPEEFPEILEQSSHLTFNSLQQYQSFRAVFNLDQSRVSFGIRINPEYSTVETDLYNPCSPGSRLGVLSSQFSDRLPKGIEGLHFHNLCESDASALEQTLLHVEERFGPLLHQAKWVNMGGGHLMTRKGYDIERIIHLLQAFQDKYKVKVILEPGSAIAWETGFLKTRILDIVENQGIRTAIIDASFTAHMPDTLEMPYRPMIRQATEVGKGTHAYRIGGMTCLAGDFLETYHFSGELQIGDVLLFEDMIHYTMVKTTMFNGVKHPSIAIWKKEGSIEVVRTFGYEDFKFRLS